MRRPETGDTGNQSDWAAISRDGQLESGDRLGVGFWVEGDGSGAVLNVQLLSPRHITGFADHYVVLDFTGWRYVELVEPESSRLEDYGWPYSDNLYLLYRSQIDFQQVEGLNLWLNNIPAAGAVTARIGPIHALPLAPVVLCQPELRIGGVAVKIPMNLATGDYLELDDAGACRRYNLKGEVADSAVLPGCGLWLEPGETRVEISAGATAGRLAARMRLTVICDIDSRAESM